MKVGGTYLLSEEIVDHFGLPSRKLIAAWDVVWALLKSVEKVCPEVVHDLLNAVGLLDAYCPGNVGDFEKVIADWQKRWNLGNHMETWGGSVVSIFAKCTIITWASQGRELRQDSFSNYIPEIIDSEYTGRRIEARPHVLRDHVPSFRFPFRQWNSFEEEYTSWNEAADLAFKKEKDKYKKLVLEHDFVSSPYERAMHAAIENEEIKRVDVLETARSKRKSEHFDWTAMYLCGPNEHSYEKSCRRISMTIDPEPAVDLSLSRFEKIQQEDNQEERLEIRTEKVKKAVARVLLSADLPKRTSL